MILRPLAAAVLAMALAACAERSDDLGPPTLHYGQDVCDICSMIISEDRFSSAIALRRDGRVEYLLFDDAGEMLAAPAPQADELRWWVHDADTREWIDGRTAIYLVSESLMTPMGTGVAAYATRAAAEEARITWPGKLMDFPTVRESLSAGP
ncbi:MAG: nitrous oxide reductase accessory protein NosL [Phycisphaerales bacterium JB039]